jgi:hypothetical protein
MEFALVPWIIETTGKSRKEPNQMSFNLVDPIFGALDLSACRNRGLLMKY